MEAMAATVVATVAAVTATLVTVVVTAVVMAVATVAAGLTVMCRFTVSVAAALTASPVGAFIAVFLSATHLLMATRAAAVSDIMDMPGIFTAPTGHMATRRSSRGIGFTDRFTRRTSPGIEFIDRFTLLQRTCRASEFIVPSPMLRTCLGDLGAVASS
jgi:hypothetical protein